jgi:predicted permease
MKANILPANMGDPTIASSGGSTAPVSNQKGRAIRSQLKAGLKSIISPASLTILISFPIALVPQLKALFVEDPRIHFHPAPDGQPPLAFVLDIANFMGAASVPLGLICLGSALARINVPLNQWRTLPIGAISSLAIGKTIVTPVLGVLITNGLVALGMIPKEDKVLRFVCM